MAAVVAAAFGGDDEARLVARLHGDGDAAISLVADEQGAIVGHILLSRLVAPVRALALAPLAVAPGRQGSGVGSALVRVAIDRARQGGWQAIFVLGDVDYYGRFGFDGASAAGFSSPYAGPHFMALALAELPVGDGEIAYPRAFADL